MARPARHERVLHGLSCANSAPSIANMRTLTLFAALALGTTVAAHAAPAAGRSAPARSTKSRPAATAAWKPVVPFIEDDFGRALALAKERKLPVFIEGWAPW